MNRTIIALAGFLFICAGIITAFYQTTLESNLDRSSSVLEKIQEGEEYLKQSGPTGKEKALTIFSELAGKQNTSEFEFRIKYNQARALEKNGDHYLALDIYKSLRSKANLTEDEKNLLAYSLGNLLLRLDQEVEGKGHLESVLRTSADSKLRSKVLQSLGDFSYRKKEYELARKNYILSLQEDTNNTDSRIGWGRTLRKQGKEWASFDVFDEYIDTENQLSGAKTEIVDEYKNSVFSEAMQLYSKKTYWKSIELFQKSLSINPSPSVEENSYYHIASAYDALGRLPQALEYLNKTLANQVYTLDQQALYKKGTIYFRQGKYTEAASVFQTIVDKYPKNHITEKAIAWKKESLDQLKDEDEMPVNDDLSFEGVKQERKNSVSPLMEKTNQKASGNDLEF
ncbi:hemolysin [Leptospira ryugenii]|uniref:Hemolysin n=1 Tax=Leptospira ryugenii TaxID=1917863 RepID=A0A2P2DYT3_9LEPT|nr:tetratricopeptide repeat protein [Leptospira ryugenii]GBF49772.1 hemolysin [Leptospira ryugenii]